MKARILAAALGLGLGAAPALAAPLTITFEPLSNGEAITTQVAGLGVTFSNARADAFGTPGLFGLKLIDLAGTYLPSPTNPIVAVFDSAISTATILAGNVGERGALMRAYDAVSGGNLLDQDSFAGVGLGVDNFGPLTVTATGIRRLASMQRNLAPLGPNGPETPIHGSGESDVPGCGRRRARPYAGRPGRLRGRRVGAHHPARHP